MLELVWILSRQETEVQSCLTVFKFDNILTPGPLVKIWFCQMFFAFHFVKLVFKCLMDFAPSLSAKANTGVMRLQSGSIRVAPSGNCKIPFCKTDLAQTVFSLKGAKSWNLLQENLWNLLTIEWDSDWDLDSDRLRLSESKSKEPLLI